MTWVRLDDGFFRHPKARAAGKDGRALFVAGLCWSADNLTDGFIPTASLAQVLHDAEVRAPTVVRLVDAGLWEPTDVGWHIHDFLDFNKSREAVLKERDAWRKRQTRARNNGLSP